MRGVPLDTNPDHLSFIINHVFLPPKLPQKSEVEIGENNFALLKFVQGAARAYHERRGFETDYEWVPVVKMLTTLCQLENNNSLDSKALRKVIQNMETGDVVVLHISAQNAGLILRQFEEVMVFESFEVSPLAEEVLRTTGKLRCSYPGPAISVDLQKAKNTTFLTELTTFLEKMNRDVLDQAAWKGTKAGSIILEERETPSPKFITEMLTGILRGMGSPAFIQRIEKRIADDVLWDNARTPWRRSPLWLVIRVALQTTLRLSYGSDAEYKVFMVFLMAKILELALLLESFPSDILFIMNTKLSRRVEKIQGGWLPDFVLVEARRVGDWAYKVLNTKWTEIQEYYTTPPKWSIEMLKPKEDVRLTMYNSKDYLKGAKGTKYTKMKRSPFVPNQSKRIIVSPRNLPELSSFKTSMEKGILLADFELWIAENLDTWAIANMNREKACAELAERLEAYISAAKPTYSTNPERYSALAAKQTYSANPERYSIFILTIMEIWVALDKIAVNNRPLLSEYLPGFTDGVFYSLLLPQAQQRIRLHTIEEYLKVRKTEATLQNPDDSIFSSTLTERSFVVRYFDDSHLHQELLRKILDEAEEKLEKKRHELQVKEAEYLKYLETADGLSCEFFTHWSEGWRVHHRRCQKCEFYTLAEKVRIEVFEWPLPKEILQQKAVVFELKCPLGFSVWRDTTYNVLVELSAPPQSPQNENPSDNPKPLEYLSTFSGLEKYFQAASRPRAQQIQWSSFTKSFLKSHYRYTRLPTTMSTICVNNGLFYGLYDQRGQKWAKESISHFNIQQACTFRLPDGPYKPLQYTLRSTNHTPNQIISRQSECPPDIQLHEYVAFGLVRAGRRVQWLNILRELRSRTLTFSNEAVSMLIVQCAWQVGPPGPSSTIRESHIDLQDEEFGRNMLCELNNTLKIIEANWQEVITAQTLIILAAQLLSFSEHESITKGASEFLREARRVCLLWTRELSAKLHDCKPQDMKELQIRVVQMAAVCRETYNVEPSHIQDMLHSRKDISTLVECAIIIYDNLPVDTLTRSTRTLLVRDRRLTHATENYLRTLIVDNKIGLDLTCVWDTYRSGSAWKCLQEPNSRWVIVRTAKDSTKRSQEVHYNLLTGQLLIDGSPLGRMPVDYISHSTYKELFGQKVLVVVPSKSEGLVFQTKQEMEGYQVGFAMHGKDLIIRTRRETDSGVYFHQYIPHTILKGDLPVHIIEKYFYWLDLSSNKIELRDQENPWSADDNRYCNLGLNVLYLGSDERLLDIRSPTTAAITLALDPLEYRSYIDVRYGRGVVSAHLPRLKLDFYLNPDQKLECRQFPGMVIDNNRDIGTLIGLGNFLVVRQGAVRSVIIPYGKVHFEQHQGHVKVDIDTKGPTWVKYHIYTIDPILGRLVGNGSLASHLYKIYLHAITAFCLPDTLTSRTGTEEALYLLRSATTWSFHTLDKEVEGEQEGMEIELFKLIASLTPRRVYYPEHLKYMQMVTWNCLSPISQHDAFDKIVKAVSSHASRFHMFQEGIDMSSSNPPILYKGVSEPHLSMRASIRNASFRTHEFGGSLPSSRKDSIYAARDVLNDSIEECRVYYISEVVQRWPLKMNVCLELMEIFKVWGGLGDETVELTYDQRWLDQDLGKVWFGLYRSLVMSSRERHTYKLMFLLGTLAYSSKIELDLIETLLAFATVPRFQRLHLPLYRAYTFEDGFKPESKTLMDALEGCAVDFSASDEANLLPKADEDEEDLSQRRSKTYNRNLKHQKKSFVDKLVSQWPCEYPDHPTESFPLIDLSSAMATVTPHFRIWYRNLELQEHVLEIQNELSLVNKGETRQAPAYSFTPGRNENPSIHSAIRLDDLLNSDPPSLPDPPTVVGQDVAPKGFKPGPAHIDGSLESLLQDFRSGNPTKFGELYVKGLEESFDALRENSKALQDHTVLTSDTQSPALVDILELFKVKCEEYLEGVSRAIRTSLIPSRQEAGWMSYQAGLWPRISPILLLQQLSMNRSLHIPAKWKTTLVTYGKAIAMLQRSQRLIKNAPEPGREADASSDFSKELENIGHQDWDPIERTDWLLMEIENNILVRPVQAHIASKMISPDENCNSIMQLCMGEGKTSIIVPIAAAALADGEKMVRVVVLKPLSGQMFQTLVQRLGGLVNRRIYFMPFSRRVKMGIEEVGLVRDIYGECRRGGGILLVQPEHILSFKLLGLERLYNSEKKGNDTSSEASQIAKGLIEIQQWLGEKSRDILDESDELLSIRHELIYTMGEPKPIQNHPDRWVVVQELLGLFHQHFRKNPADLQDFEVVNSEYFGGFDSIRILSKTAGRKLLKQITSKIMSDHLRAFSFRRLPEHIRKLAEKFITDPNLRKEQCLSLFSHYGDDQASTGILFLLRGLIAHNILLFALYEKRWKVDYGLDLRRSMLAVPYRAKDSPSGKAEFSHPDVVVTLTCLSYYYSGLAEYQLQTCFRDIYKSDNPTMEYERWLEGVPVPKPSLRHLNAINLEDKKQWESEILPTFRYNKAVIDFYLSGVVFPMQAKEFSYKLSTSGWDIAEEKTHPTTGFSGTNDNKYLLPLSITQRDTKEQLNTNARVLSYLLQPINDYTNTAGPNDKRLNAKQLLEFLTHTGKGSQIQVLLDVGAQVLELRNEEVAVEWLKMVQDDKVKAAVYFNDNDELTVITRDGAIEPLMISAFADRLDGCLVYLDEAHTRGTDLKLPANSRAAVTLGPNLTKDRLVQACMRMRKLGHGQSVLFCAPPEIHRRILKVFERDINDSIQVRDVLYWCMHQTCSNTRKLVPVWAKQGISHQKRHSAYKDLEQSFPKDLLEKEAKTLEQYYGFERSKNNSLPELYKTTNPSDNQLRKIREKCTIFDVTTFSGASMLEEQEQERELSHEAECEREIEGPPKAVALKHTISEDVRYFVDTGFLPRHPHSRDSFIPAFEIFCSTSANEHFDQIAWPKNIFATVDFSRVVEKRRDSKIDNFLRPVNWILSSNVEPSILIVMSPYEINVLLPQIRQSRLVVLHMYSPRVTKASPSYESLNFCTIPRLPTTWSLNSKFADLLNIFAGQLYFLDYETYDRVLKFLGLHLSENPLKKAVSIGSDGFIERPYRKLLEIDESPFEKSPVAFLRTLIGIRRKGQNYIKTDMGHILHGRVMLKEDFEYEETKTE